MAAKVYDLTILMPVYNEEAHLPHILKKMEGIGLPGVEVIIVDDGSQDSSKQIIHNWAKNKDLPFSVKLVSHAKNRGKGAGIQTGLRMAEGKYFVIQDADLEYDPAELPMLLEAALAANAPVVYGSRFLGSIEGMALPNYIGNRFYNFLLFMMYGARITDMHTCYKLIQTDLFKELDIQAQGFGYAPEVISKLLRRGIPVHEVPISYVGRRTREGKKIDARDGIECLAHLIKYRFIHEKKLFAAKKTI